MSSLIEKGDADEINKASARKVGYDVSPSKQNVRFRKLEVWFKDGSCNVPKMVQSFERSKGNEIRDLYLVADGVRINIECCRGIKKDGGEK